MSGLLVRFTNEICLQVGEIAIACRPTDGYINLTQLCKAGGKEYGNWKRNAGTADLLVAVSDMVGIETRNLIKWKKHGLGGATWGHPQVAIAVAYWISPAFAAKVLRWIHELFVTGTVVYGSELPTSDVMQEQINQLQCELVDANEHISELGAKINILKEYKSVLKGIMCKLDLPIHRNEDTEISRARFMANSIYAKLQEYAPLAIPSKCPATKHEIFALFRLSESDYYMMGVQESGFNSRVRDLKRKNPYMDDTPVKKWSDIPNAILIKERVRSSAKKIATIRGSSIELIDDYERELVDLIDNIISEKSREVKGMLG